MSALLMATAAPIVRPVVASSGSPLDPPVVESVADRTALPSAVALASVSAALASVKRRPLVTVIAPMSVAREIVVARLMATAAATETPPDEVDALGVWPVPLLVPPFDAAV